MTNYQTIYVIISHSIFRNEDMLSEAFLDRKDAQKQLEHFQDCFKGYNTYRLETCTLMGKFTEIKE